MSQSTHLRKYNLETTIDFELYEVDGVNLRSDWVPAQVDCEIMKDEGVSTMCTNTAIDEGSTYSLVLTATEMTAARLVLKVVDAATKVFLDKVIIIETYGNVSAMHAFDLDTALQAVDVTQISGDATAADNLELQYDGTGLTGDEFPSTQSQVGNISTGSASISTIAISTEDTTPAPVGTPTNTYADTAQENGIYHSWVPAGGELEFAYNFNIGANASPTQVTWVGYCQGINDICTVYARNWVGGTWEQVGSVVGTALATMQRLPFDLTTAHVNTGANSGDVRFRFVSTGGDIIVVFATDRILCSYTIVNQSVGYANGAIWIDTNASNTNTVDYVDGVADNPVSTLAAALTLSASLGINLFNIAQGSTLTFVSTFDSKALNGLDYILNLGGQQINNCTIIGAVVSGIATGDGGSVLFERCKFGDCTLPEAAIVGSAWAGKITANQVGTYFFDRCASAIAGTATPSFDFGVGIGNVALNMRHYSGGIEIENMGETGTDTMSLEGHGQLVINANCIAGVVARRGHFTTTDNANGVLTLSDEATFDHNSIIDSIKAETDLFDGMIIEDSAGNQFTIAALQNARGTNNANTVVPDVAGTAGGLHGITDGKVDAVQVDVTTIAGDVANIDGDAMRGTDSANTVVPDAAGTAATLHGITDGKVDAVQSDVTLIKAETDLLDGMIIEDSAGNQFTIAALSNAPSGTGGDATQAKQDIIIADVTGINGDAMRGTNSANTVVPDAAGTAAGLHSTTDGKVDAVQSDVTLIKAETDLFDGMIIEDGGGNQFTVAALTNASATGGDATQAKQDIIIADVTGINGDAMRGTNSANTVVPDAAGTAAALIGGLNDVSAIEFVTALMADTGFTQGGTMTFQELQNMLAAWVAGNWRDKPGDSTIQELLDPDDNSTVILEMVISETTPFRTITVQI